MVETNARCLIEAVRQIPKPRYICLEEGTPSEWLYEVLSPHAEKVVAVRESRGLNRNFNHTLKAIFKGAATTVIGRAEDEPICRHYVAP